MMLTPLNISSVLKTTIYFMFTMFTVFNTKIVQGMLKIFYLFLAQVRDPWLQSRLPFCKAGIDYIKHG